MYHLYYSPGDASLAPHFVLSELGVPYELHLVDRSTQQQKSPEYLTLNPNGKIPVLITEELPIWEAAAICLFLADRHCDRDLVPSFTEKNARAGLYQWLIYFTNTLQPALMDLNYPELPAGSTFASQVRKGAEKRIYAALDIIEYQLVDNTFILGEKITICDYYALMLIYWSRDLIQNSSRYRQLKALAKVLTTRPSIQHVLNFEGLCADQIIC